MIVVYRCHGRRIISRDSLALRKFQLEFLRTRVMARNMNRVHQFDLIMVYFVTFLALIALHDMISVLSS
jgi:hypothetical protein